MKLQTNIGKILNNTIYLNPPTLLELSKPDRTRNIYLFLQVPHPHPDLPHYQRVPLLRPQPQQEGG